MASDGCGEAEDEEDPICPKKLLLVGRVAVPPPAAILPMNWFPAVAPLEMSVFTKKAMDALDELPLVEDHDMVSFEYVKF